MTDYTMDTPNMARIYCPGCEPEADPIREILDVRWCPNHNDNAYPRGSEDERVQALAYLSGASEAGGSDNRLWCAAIHRRPA